MVLMISMLNFYMASSGRIKQRQGITLDLLKTFMVTKPSMTFTNHIKHMLCSAHT